MTLVKQKNKRWVALGVCICFVATLFPEAHAALPSIEMAGKAETPRILNIDIPTELASVDEWYQAPSKAKPKLIVHIQDAHANYEAQTKIRDVIKYLNTNYGFKTILVEGAASELDPNILKLFPDQERNVKLADELAKIGEVTGAEMFLIENSDAAKGVGIEKPELYRRNFDALQKVYSEDEFVSGFFAAYEKKLGQIASRSFGPRMIQALAEWRKFETGHREFLPFVSALAELSKKVLEIDLGVLYSQIEWPQLTRLLVLQRVEKELEKTIDPRPTTNAEESARKGVFSVKQQAELEKQQIIDLLKAAKVSDSLIQALERFDEKTANLNRIGSSEVRQASAPRALMEALVEEGGKVGFNIREYPAFAKYAGYLILRGEIVPGDLFEEIKKLFDLVLESLVKDAPSAAIEASDDLAARKRLLLLHRDEMLARKLLKLELSHDEWLAVLNRQDRFYPDDLNRRMLEQLGQNTRVKEVGGEEATQMKKLNEAFRAAFTFYSAAVNRDTFFFQRTQEVLAQTDKAILITGGFHAEGMKYFFRKYDINYGTLTPRITQEFSNEQYRKVMMAGSEPAAVKGTKSRMSDKVVKDIEKNNLASPLHLDSEPLVSGPNEKARKAILTKLTEELSASNQQDRAGLDQMESSSKVRTSSDWQVSFEETKVGGDSLAVYGSMVSVMDAFLSKNSTRGAVEGILKKFKKQSISDLKLSGRIKVSYHSQGNHKYVYRVKMESDSSKDVELIIAAKISKGKAKSASRELPDLERLNGSSVPTLLDFGITNDGREWFVEDFIDGPTVSESMANEGGAVSEGLQRQIVQNAFSIGARFKGAVPADMNPGNYIVNTERGIVMVDLGDKRIYLDDKDHSDLQRLRFVAHLFAHYGTYLNKAQSDEPILDEIKKVLGLKSPAFFVSLLRSLEDDGDGRSMAYLQKLENDHRSILYASDQSIHSAEDVMGFYRHLAEKVKDFSSRSFAPDELTESKRFIFTADRFELGGIDSSSRSEARVVEAAKEFLETENGPQAALGAGIAATGLLVFLGISLFLPVALPAIISYGIAAISFASVAYALYHGFPAYIDMLDKSKDGSTYSDEEGTSFTEVASPAVQEQVQPTSSGTVADPITFSAILEALETETAKAKPDVTRLADLAAKMGDAAGTIEEAQAAQGLIRKVRSQARGKLSEAQTTNLIMKVAQLAVKLNQFQQAQKLDARDEVVVTAKASLETIFASLSLEDREILKRMTFDNWENQINRAESFSASQAVAVLITFGIISENDRDAAKNMAKLASLAVTKVADEQISEFADMLRNFFPDMASDSVGRHIQVLSEADWVIQQKSFEVLASLNPNLEIVVFLDLLDPLQVGEVPTSFKNLKVRKTNKVKAAVNTLVNKLPWDSDRKSLLVIPASYRAAFKLNAKVQMAVDAYDMSDVGKNLTALFGKARKAQRLARISDLPLALEEQIFVGGENQVLEITDESITNVFAALQAKYQALLKVMQSA